MKKQWLKVFSCLWFVCAIALTILAMGCAYLPPPPPPVIMKIHHAPIPETPKQLDIPRYENGQPYFFYTTAKQRESQLNLTPPEFGVEDILLRIYWTWSPGLQQKGSLYEFRKFNGTWKGQILIYDVRFDPWRNYETVANVRRTNFVPANGWEEFERRLVLHGIAELITDDDMEGFRSWIHGYLQKNPTHIIDAFSVEYATPNLYRFYLNRDPRLAGDCFLGSAEFNKFLIYISEGFAGAEESTLAN